MLGHQPGSDSDESTSLLKRDIKHDKIIRFYKFIRVSCHKIGPSDRRSRIVLIDMLKSWLAFAISTILTFVPLFRNSLGFYSHFATVSVLLFHPGKSVGAMLETVLLGVFGVVFSLIVCLFTELIVGIFEMQNNWFLNRSIVILSSLFISIFIIAYTRAKHEKVPVFIAAMMSNMILIVQLTNDSIGTIANAPQSIGISQQFNWMVKNSLVLPVLAGMSVSLFTNIAVFPKSAKEELQELMQESLISTKNLLENLVNLFLLPPAQAQCDSNVSPIFDYSSSEILRHLMTKHQKILSFMYQAQRESKLEFLNIDTLSSDYYRNIGEGINRLSQHLSGMRSSIAKRENWLLHKGFSGIYANSKISSSQQFPFDDDLYIFIDSVGDSLRNLTEHCKHILDHIAEMVSSRELSRFNNHLFSKRDPKIVEDSLIGLKNLQKRLESAIEEFNSMQKAQMTQLYERNKFDGSPKDEAFLAYFVVFCLIEFAKVLKDDLLESMKLYFENLDVKNGSSETNEEFDEESFDDVSYRSYDCNSEQGTFHVEPKESNIMMQGQYYQYFRTQTDGAFHDYIKTPSNDAFFHSLKTGRLAQSLQGNPIVQIKNSLKKTGSTIKSRLMIWNILTRIGRSFKLKFALKSAIVVTGLASLAFLPNTKSFYRDYRGQWAILSAAMSMTNTVGGSNLAGLYRILGTVAGSFYSYISWKIFPENPFGLAFMLWSFSVPCFYVFIATVHTQAARICLIAISAIVMANFSNMENSQWNYSIEELAWKRGITVISGMVIGLVATWYVWPYEARVELRKNLSDMLLNMGILYSRLVEVFVTNASDDQDCKKSAKSEFSFATSPRISISNFHRYYYTDFQYLPLADRISFFLTFESKLNERLFEVKQLLPLTRHEPRLKGPFPVEIYEEMLERCQNILDKFVAMRVAISNNIEITEWSDDSDKDSIKSGKNKSFLSRQSSMSSNRARRRTGTSISFIQDDLILGMAPTSSLSQTPSAKESTGSFDFNQGIVSQVPELLPLRRELVGSVLLCFYIFAGSLILKQPLPTYLPPASEARQRLMDNLKSIITSASNENCSASKAHGKRQSSLEFLQLNKPNKFINYYAYSLAMEDVIHELNLLGSNLKNLFGEIFADVVKYRQPYDHEF